jgi:adenosylcobinamide-GDP ribazoletransferase
VSGFAGLRLAVGLLTIVPVRPPEVITQREARSAMLLAPVAVVPVAGIAVLIGWVAVWLQLPGLLAGGLVVAALAFGTRAMHADGLADTTDGLGSGKEAGRALDIMRSGDIGPMGVVALILALGLQAVAAGVILGRPNGWLLLAVLICCSRAALLAGALAGVPAARPDGLGALVAGSVAVPAALLSWVLSLAIAVGAGLLAGQPVWLPLAGVALAALACAWLVSRCVRRLGGMTGDVLGALVEVSATVLLVVGAAG